MPSTETPNSRQKKRRPDSATRYIVLSPNEVESQRREQEKEKRIQRLIQVREQYKKHDMEKISRYRQALGYETKKMERNAREHSIERRTKEIKGLKQQLMERNERVGDGHRGACQFIEQSRKHARENYHHYTKLRKLGQDRYQNAMENMVKQERDEKELKMNSIRHRRIVVREIERQRSDKQVKMQQLALQNASKRQEMTKTEWLLKNVNEFVKKQSRYRPEIVPSSKHRQMKATTDFSKTYYHDNVKPTNLPTQELVQNHMSRNEEMENAMRCADIEKTRLQRSNKDLRLLQEKRRMEAELRGRKALMKEHRDREWAKMQSDLGMLERLDRLRKTREIFEKPIRTLTDNNRDAWKRCQLRMEFEKNFLPSRGRDRPDAAKDHRGAWGNPTSERHSGRPRIVIEEQVPCTST